MNLQQYAPAKLTLTLRMLDKRDDGYNNLEAFTVFLPELYDVLKVVEDTNPGLSLAETSKHIVEIDETNLIVKAFEKYATHERIVDLFPEVNEVHLELKKMLPVAAGIGGGSADCAATLNLLNRFCDNELTVTELIYLAQELGSDVPACIYSQALWMKGRGEILDPLDEFYIEDLRAIVVTPNIQCSTPEVYAQYDKIGRPRDEGIEAPAALASVCHNLHNDLALAAYDLNPELLEVKAMLESQTGLSFVLAGSGSTFFALSDPDQAQSSINSLIEMDNSRHFRSLAISEMI